MLACPAVFPSFCLLALFFFAAFSAAFFALLMQSSPLFNTKVHHFKMQNAYHFYPKSRLLCLRELLFLLFFPLFRLHNYSSLALPRGTEQLSAQNLLFYKIHFTKSIIFSTKSIMFSSTSVDIRTCRGRLPSATASMTSSSRFRFTRRSSSISWASRTKRTILKYRIHHFVTFKRQNS